MEDGKKKVSKKTKASKPKVKKKPDPKGQLPEPQVVVTPVYDTYTAPVPDAIQEGPTETVSVAPPVPDITTDMFDISNHGIWKLTRKFDIVLVTTDQMFQNILATREGWKIIPINRFTVQGYDDPVAYWMFFDPDSKSAFSSNVYHVLVPYKILTNFYGTENRPYDIVQTVGEWYSTVQKTLTPIPEPEKIKSFGIGAIFMNIFKKD